MITVSTNYSVMLLYTLVTYPYIFCSDVSNVDPIGRFFYICYCLNYVIYLLIKLREHTVHS